MMRVCQSIQELLDEELSQMWEGLDYEGISCAETKEWFAGDRYIYADFREA